MMKHLKSVIGTLLLFAVISCTEKEHGREVMGQVSFDISGDYDLIEMTRSDDSNASGSRVSDYTTMPQKDDFTLSIIDVETEEEIWNGKISQWSTDVLLPAGTYTATVTYGSLREEGFDKPYFTTGKKGDQKYPNPVKFTVLGGKTPLEVKVPVVLGNTLFKIECSDYFKKYFKINLLHQIY